MKRRTAILISGRGSNMAALIDAAKTGDIDALKAIFDAQGKPPNVSFGAPDGD